VQQCHTQRHYVPMLYRCTRICNPSVSESCVDYNICEAQCQPTGHGGDCGGQGDSLWGIVGVTVETVVDIIGEWCYNICGWGVLLRRCVRRPM